jgi:hypothetical protein
MKVSTLRLLIREAIEQVFEAEIKYNVGDRVEIDSSYGGGIGTVEMASHPFYAIKFDQTGTTDSFHFSDLRPFNDEEEEQKNKGINTGLDEGFNPPDVISLDVPLFIRMLEYAREDAKTDMDLHDVTEKAITLSITGRTLNMGDYEDIIGNKPSLNESDFEKIFHIAGVLTVDDNLRNQKDILSDIRSLPGITVVRNVEMPQDATSRYFRSTIECKIDPYPYIKQNKFDNTATIDNIIQQIKNIKGVIGFKETEEQYSTEN